MVVPQLENDIKTKDDAIEAGLSRIGILDEESIRKNSKIRELDVELKKRLKKNNQSPNDLGAGAANDDLENVKKSLKAKDALIKDLSAGKIALANELKDAQEKLNGDGGNASVEKCLKLTKDLKHKTNEVKSIDKKRNEAKASIAKYQMELNKTNNKIAESEAQNVKLNDFNNKMYEICKTKGIFKNLEEKNDIEIAAQKQIYEENVKRKGKCWFFENGFSG